MNSKLKSVLVIGGVVSAIGFALFPIIVHPKLHPEVWNEMQKETRKGIVQANVQPGNMKIWTDPFDKKTKETDSEDS